MKFEELPDWTFEVEETSASVFKVVGADKSGRTVERVGFDPDTLLEEAKQDALDLIAED